MKVNPLKRKTTLAAEGCMRLSCNGSASAISTIVPEYKILEVDAHVAMQEESARTMIRKAIEVPLPVLNCEAAKMKHGWRLGEHVKHCSLVVPIQDGLLDVRRVLTEDVVRGQGDFPNRCGQELDIGTIGNEDSVSGAGRVQCLLDAREVSGDMELACLHCRAGNLEARKKQQQNEAHWNPKSDMDQPAFEE